MPNTFISLEVPRGDGVGAAVDTALTGHPKTFVLGGPVRSGARYIIEGSNDGGATWDILLDDDDGTQVMFNARSSGAKSADCIVGKVRVRSIAGPLDADPPSITMGAPPAAGNAFFAKLDVPPQSGLGAPVDCGISAGPLKTFTVRGPIPPGSRYTILASMDGVQFDEVLLFTADQQGARSRKVMCRFVRVMRLAPGMAPVVTVGAEGLFEPGSGGGGGAGSVDVTISSAAKVGTSGTGAEEVLAEFLAPVGQLPGERLNLALSAIARREPASGSEDSGQGVMKVRIGGTPGQPDGDLLATISSLPEAEGSSTVVNVLGFPRPTVPGTLVKVIGEASRGRVTARGLMLWFSGR